MKIYLINPKFPVTYWGFEHSNDLSGAKYTTPPLALATVAALTPPDIDVEICDENIEAIDFEKECDLVGLTAYLVQGPRAFEIAEQFRKRGKTVVLGGPITSLDLDSCKGKVDVIFVGEAEYTWKQFLKDYHTGSYEHEYIQKEKVNMHDSPTPRLDLLKVKKYSHAAIQTTRGCPFGCEFCDIIVLFGRKVRCKSVPQIMNEMRAAFELNAGFIFFTDDNFIGNRKYAKELLRAIIEFNKSTGKASMQYMTQVSIDLAKDEELLQLFYEAHFNKVFIGIESPRKDSLKEAHKGQNVRSDLIADIRKIQSYNIDVSAGMIVGFDNDDVDIFQEQFDFIMETNISWAMTGMLQAVPKTPLYERLKQENRLDTSSEAVTNTSLEVNIIPKKMSKEELIVGYRWLLKQLYSYENYAKRVIGNLKAYTRKPQIKTNKPSFLQIKIVLRTLRYYLLTWDRKRRKFYMDIVKYVLLHKPYTFYDAMVHMVSFKHLHKYVYDHLEEAFTQKTAALESSLLESRRKITTAFEELRKQAAMMSERAATAYDELKSQVAAMGQQATAEYEELRKQADAINQRTAAEYDALRQYASEVSKQVAEIVSKQSVVAECEEIRKKSEVLKQRVTIAYDDLRKQAIVLSEQAATVSQRAAHLYDDLAKQATALNQKAAMLYEDMERILTMHVAPVRFSND